MIDMHRFEKRHDGVTTLNHYIQGTSLRCHTPVTQRLTKRAFS